MTQSSNNELRTDTTSAQINTAGGTYVDGNVNPRGDFVGRDKIINEAQNKQSFTVGEINATNVNMGGVQNFSGSVNITTNFSEATSGGTIVTGDQFNMSGDFRGAMFNIKSQLENVLQSIHTNSSTDESTKQKLVQLMDQVSQQLLQASPTQLEDAAKVAKRVEVLVQEANQEKPDSEIIHTLGESLLKAAGKLATSMPLILTIAKQIVDLVKTIR